MADNNIDNKLGKLFDNYAEEPSPNCWNVVSTKLDILLPIGASSSVGTSGASTFSKFLASTFGKSITIITSVAIVGASVYTFWPSNLQKNANESKGNVINNPTQNKEENVLLNTNKTTISNVKVITPSSSEKNIEPQFVSNTTVVSEDFLTQETKKQEQSVSHQVTPSNTPIENKNISTATIDDEKNMEEVITVEKSQPTVEANPIVNQNTAEQNLIFPNVFTPNGDGFNDYFVIKNIETLSQQKFVVINSTGQKVFEANNYQNNWDGTNLPDGAYFYVLETKVNGKAQTIYGTVQIIR